MDFLALMLLLMLAGVIITAGFEIDAAMRHDWSTRDMPIGCGASVAAMVAIILDSAITVGPDRAAAVRCRLRDGQVTA